MKNDNYAVVLNYFNTQTEPVNAGKVSEATGIDRKEVDAIMKKMKEDAVIVSPKRCYWEVKK
jgi:DNA-binding IscR family transcriptional regulator